MPPLLYFDWQTDTIGTLVAQADDALYQAKARGRNQHCIGRSRRGTRTRQLHAIEAPNGCLIPHQFEDEAQIMTQSQLYPQLALLERMLDLLKAMPQVRAAFLRGSFHSNEPELSSDIDLVVVATDAEPEALVELGRAVLPSAGDVQWVSLLALMPARLRALLAGPIRVDLTVVTAATLPVYEGWRILFDHDNLLRERARYTPASDTLRPEHVAAVCDEFWWRLFSCVGQIKRGQLWLALHLLSSCRDSLVQIMRWRRDPSRPFEQYANLEQHLTPEDQQALAQTLASYDLRSIATALLCTADAFDPAAREVAARVQAHYPAALAQLSKEFFIREFWALIAPGPTMSA